MASKSTFIKLDRNILRWGWYGNANVFRVFIHILLTAGTECREVDGHVIGRGDVLTSLDRMGQQLSMSKQEIRTALATLKKTGEITQYKVGRNVVYHIANYDRYQGKAAQKQHDSNTILTRFPTQLSTQSATRFSEAANIGGDCVSGVLEECEQHDYQHDLQHGLQHESNTILTQSQRENEKETEKEKRTKKEKDKEKAKEKDIYIYNTHSLGARTREASGEGEDNTDDVPLLKNYGKYGNVRLTEAEHDELCGEFGEDVANGAINILDGHIKKRGAAFKSECHAVDIREWCVSKYKRLQAEKAALEKITPQEYPADYIRMVMRVTGVERALTRPELACVDRWKADGISEDLLTLAYEKTVAKINKPHFVYMDKMLAGWQEKGLSTPVEVDEYFKNPENRVLGGTVGNDRLDFSLDEIFERP